jgi:nucleotide-binding universal stress UspA family protein
MKVLVPIDDSSYSDAAVSSIGARQWPPGAQFLMYSVINSYDKLIKFLPSSNTQKVIRLKDEQEQEVIRMLLRRCNLLRAALSDVHVEVAVDSGEPAAKIVETATDWGAQLIVMGSHGRHDVQLHALGSVTAQVIEQIPCSMEVIRVLNRPGKTWQDQRRVLICYDGSEHSKAALDWVACGAWAPHQEIAVVCVLNTIDNNVSIVSGLNHRKAAKLQQEALMAAQSELDRHVRRLRLRLPGVAIVGQVLEGYAAETILSVAESFLADLIVMGAHSEQSGSDAVLGSVAKRIACESRCCVKVVRANPSVPDLDLLQHQHSF